MQIIERNSFNVRSAVYRLRTPDDSLEFILFPMIHIGSREFYAAVRQKLLECDLILAEGVRSRNVFALTLSYSVVRKIKRMNLVTQREALSISDLSERIVSSDMSGEAFDAHWAELPIATRVRLLLAVPIYVVYLFLFGTKNVIAENITVDDLPSRDEILDSFEDFEKLDSLIVDKRDQVVIARIENLYQTRRHEKKVVAVVYGAVHMRSIIQFLTARLGYRITGSEWLTVFDL